MKIGEDVLLFVVVLKSYSLFYLDLVCESYATRCDKISAASCFYEQ